MPVTKRSQAIVHKPKQRRAKATVSAILEASAQILARDGWDRFNTNAVAKRAGVSIGSLYEYFPNKQALVDQIANDHLSKGEAHMIASSSALGSAPELQDIVSGLVDGVVAVHEDDPRLHRVLSSEVPLSPNIRARMERLRDNAIELLAVALEPHIGESRVAAQLLFDVADAVVHRWFVEDDDGLATPQRLSEQLRLMMHAYLDRMSDPL